MAKTIRKNTEIVWFLFIMALILSFYPYEFQDSLFPFLQQELILKIAYSSILLILLFSRGYNNSVPKILANLAIVHMLGFLMSFGVHGGASRYLGEYVTIFMVVLLIMVIDARLGLFRFFELYNKWVLLMAIGGCIAFAMALVGISPFHEFVNSRDLRPAYSWGVSYTNVYYGNFIRYSGYFDEPGAMGYWMVFAIAINRLFIKNKWVEWGLLIFGLFSFSFGFIIQAIAFLMLFSISKKNTGKTLIAALAVFIIGLFIYRGKGGEESAIYEATFGRYERYQEAENALGGREEMAEMAKKYFLENPVWGMGRDQFANSPYYMQDNPYETLAKDGIVGMVYLYFPFLVLLYWGIKRRDMELLKVWIFMVLSFMHRPFHPAPLYYFIFYSIVFLYYKKMQQERLQKKMLVQS